MDTAPIIEDFSQNTAFLAAAAEKPWCDYSTATGSPGIGSDGLSYTSGRNSIFCDGLHDGLIVVNAAGYSDPNIVKPDSGMQLLIRGSSSDQSKTSPMEVRTIVRAYQWLFPTINALDGKLPTKMDMVSKWKCSFEGGLGLLVCSSSWTLSKRRSVLRSSCTMYRHGLWCIRGGLG